MRADLQSYILPLAAGILVTAVLLVIRGIAIRLLHRWADRTSTVIDDFILESIRTPSVFWSIAIGLAVGVALSAMAPAYAQSATRAIHVLVIFSVTLTAANLSGLLLTHYIEKADLPFKTSGLAYGILKGTIFAVGLLIILSVLGISIAPLLTALGVGGLAVALALQDTLSNLFAGLHILIEKSVRVGDFIRLESGQEGCVLDITWRTTRIRMQPNTIVVIPNSKLSQSVVTNYSLPEKRMTIAIPVSVSYAADVDLVEQVLLDEARQAVGQVPGLASEPEPEARFIPGFGESSLDLTLLCPIGEFADQPKVQHELRKRILRRFRKEGIEMPYPHRVVHLREGRA